MRLCLQGDDIMSIDNLNILFRLLTALLLGGLIGLERESHGRPAGFRTHILVSLGSALIMILSMYAFRSLPETSYDPGRLAAQVVSGIGFLGAGTIMREGATIRGLTTAASLWAVAGIGMAAGAGAFFPAIATAFLVVITLRYLSKLEKLFSSKRQILSLEITDQPGQLGVIASTMGRYNMNIRSIEIEQLTEDRTRLEIMADIPAKLDKIMLVEDMKKIPGVYSTHFGRE